VGGAVFPSFSDPILTFFGAGSSDDMSRYLHKTGSFPNQWFRWMTIIMKNKNQLFALLPDGRSFGQPTNKEAAKNYFLAEARIKIKDGFFYLFLY
jgi:hypothetical protein